MAGRTGALAGRPAGAGPGPARAAVKPGARPAASGGASGRRSATLRVLLLVALLAGLGVGGALLVSQGLERPPVTAGPPPDPSRTWLVADAIDHRQMQPVWTLVGMSGLERLCEKARAWTVGRQDAGPGAVPTRFIVYCRGQGFWVIQADAEAERFGTVGPLERIEDAEAIVDQGGNFIWGARRPGQRSFVGGLAR